MARKSKHDKRKNRSEFRMVVTDLYPTGVSPHSPTSTRHAIVVFRGSDNGIALLPGFKSKKRAESVRDKLYPILKREWDREEHERLEFYGGLRRG